MYVKLTPHQLLAQLENSILLRRRSRRSSVVCVRVLCVRVRPQKPIYSSHVNTPQFEYEAYRDRGQRTDEDRTA